MGNIRLLDELTINKIAAGEVIEKPASVIKEMIENSIDAKATNITVEIHNGGISYIKITDNGKGIAQDDLEMAFERHATSKIRNVQDLENVTSMGFRGEALASIAAISKVELISKTQEQNTGYKVIVEGGKILDKQEIGCQTGTTIIVENLFYNTPVRYKFLKKDYTETGYIEDVVTRIALVNPDISFKLISSGKTILQTSGNGDITSVIYSIYGKDIAQGILPVNYNYEDIKITGVIGKPEIARSNRSNQLFFVNKRYVKDKILTAATEQAYKGRIDAGKFGFVVLNLEMTPAKVDVNVHPAKLEVRFQEESKIFQAVFHSIKDTMAKGIAESDTTTVVDNIIIQSSQSQKIEEPIENEKVKTTGLFGWRKNREEKTFGKGNNIIEDLYNQKKIEEEPDIKPITESNIEPNILLNNEKQNNEETPDAVNTSDVLKELKQISENVKKDIKEEAAKKEIAQEVIKPETIKIEENNLPDGTTYTYVGENKDKIEDLLRQLHPEKYKEQQEEKPIIVEEKVAEEETQYNLVEDETKKIETPKTEQNIEKTQEIKIETAKQNSSIEEDEEFQKPKAFSAPQMANKHENMPEFNKMYEKLFGTPVIQEKSEEAIEEEKQINAVDIIKDNISVFEGIESFEKPTYKIIGLAFESYIIVEIEKEMYIVNCNTAREKIIYEKLKNKYFNGTITDSQMLLLPDIIELTSKQAEVVNENLNILLQAGFNFEEFGENTIKLNGVPTECLDLDTKTLFVDILDAMNTVARTSKQEKEEKFIATIAEDMAQMMSDSVSSENINEVLDELLSLPDPFKYGVDKPIAIKMTKYDIERKFSRK